MTSLSPAEAAPPDELRRRRLLDAALAAFLRYGFRRTSMEEVARAAHLSRQGLYLHFATKEELFRAALRYALDTALAAASARLADQASSLEERLTAAFDEWIGRYVSLADGVSDLHEASKSLGGPLIAEYEETFVELLAKLLRSSGLPAAYKSLGINARQLADTLNATALGLKHTAPTRPQFVAGVSIAVRALCQPLRER